MIFVSYSRIRILKKGIRIRMKRIRILKMPIRFIRNRIQKINRIIRMKRIGKNLSVYTGNNLDTKEFIQMWGYLFLYNEIYTDIKDFIRCKMRFIECNKCIYIEQTKQLVSWLAKWRQNTQFAMKEIRFIPIWIACLHQRLDWNW